jgi:DNA-binding IclR family transcriptional regulator
MPRTTIMTAVRPACHDGDNPEWVERLTCKAMVAGLSSPAGQMLDAFAGSAGRLLAPSASIFMRRFLVWLMTKRRTGPG